MLDFGFHMYTVEKHSDKMEKTNHEKAKVKHIYKYIYTKMYISSLGWYLYILCSIYIKM